MEFQFHPALQLEEEQYGDAILSRFPMRLVHAGPLPVPPSQPRREPRGALWVAVEVEGRTVQLLNTHLGLGNKERLMQVEALLGPDWLANPQCCDPIILCGDLNATPNSQVCRRLARRLRDAQRMIDEHRPRRTFFSRLALGRIDHVFVGAAITVVRVEVPRTQLVCTASDHLPLVVEVRFEG
jgi:endonuclease/exonuclease/phosphatase family metal-dependent hydrolase